MPRGGCLAVPLIAADGVSKSFGLTEVLRHVSLAVAANGAHDSRVEAAFRLWRGLAPGRLK